MPAHTAVLSSFSQYKNPVHAIASQEREAEVERKEILYRIPSVTKQRTNFEELFINRAVLA